MKKILFLLLITIASNSYAQEGIGEMFKSKEKREAAAKARAGKEKEELKLSLIPKISKVPKSNIGKAGFYLQKSAKLQYAAIGCSIASAGMIVASTLIDDKFEVDKKSGEITTKKSGAKTALIVGGAASFVAAICCELISINYKMKSGKYLQLHTNGTGGSVALIF